MHCAISHADFQLTYTPTIMYICSMYGELVFIFAKYHQRAREFSDANENRRMKNAHCECKVHAIAIGKTR